MKDSQARATTAEPETTAVAATIAAPGADADPRATPGSGSALPRLVVVLLGTAALVVTVAGMRAAAGLLGSVLLALVLVVAVAPLGQQLEKRGAPSWLATLVVLIGLNLLLLGLVAVLVVCVARLAGLVPQYQDQMQGYLDGLAAHLRDLGVTPDRASETTANLDLAKLTDALGTVVSGLASALSNLVFLLALLLFMAFDSAGFGRRLSAVAEVRPGAAAALQSFASGTRRYLLVSSIFGLIVAVIDGVLLAALGVPLPVLWAVLSFITNYIPNVGFFLGLVPPALLALLNGGVSDLVVVVVAYCAVNFVIQSVLQPKFVGDSVGLSVTVTFLALGVWSFVLGPLGALLAVPVTLLVKAVLLDGDPSARWVIALLDASPPPARAAVPKARRRSGRRSTEQSPSPDRESRAAPP